MLEQITCNFGFLISLSATHRVALVIAPKFLPRGGRPPTHMPSHYLDAPTWGDAPTSPFAQWGAVRGLTQEMPSDAWNFLGEPNPPPRGGFQNLAPDNFLGIWVLCLQLTCTWVLTSVVGLQSTCVGLSLSSVKWFRI